MASQAYALPQYRLIGVTGDVTYIQDLNNNNQILMGTGQCASISEPCTYIRDFNGNGFTFGTGVVGLPYPGAPAGSVERTVVTAFNSALDMIGFSDAGFGPGRLNIPTIWIAGMPFDRSDPVNAGLVFTSDPGTGTTAVSLATLDIVNIADLGLGALDEAAILAGTYNGRFNANGFFTINMTVPGSRTDGWLLAPLATVPEPGTVGIVAASLLLLATQRRRQGLAPLTP